MHAPSFLSAGLMALALAAPAAATAGAKPEYRPLAGASQLKRGETLKPQAGNVDLPPVVLETRVHYHADGSVRYECSAPHAPAAKPAPRSAGAPR
jgi:hypothetical protein